MEILFGAVILLLAVVGWRLFVVERRLKSIFGKAQDAGVENAVAKHTEALQLLDGELKEISASHKALLESFTLSVQKVSMIRFNPFSDSGGDQSFAIALLDGNNNGVVLSSIYVHGRPMVYAKPVQLGQSRYALSGEEEAVLKKAIASA
ncbi:MAG: DUF4446 family protein [Candidatus Ryanbacteria bacterium]|nr:DUF4446 family protein [Candidatus Ryanbacteria bacterium]